jgi:hypothetical protein
MTDKTIAELKNAVAKNPSNVRNVAARKPRTPLLHLRA